MSRMIGGSTAPASAVLAVLISTLTGHASDNKIFPGTLCWPVKETANAVVFAGVLYNASSVTLPVQCPIVKDNRRIESLAAYLYDNHPFNDVYCLLWIRGGDGTTYLGQSGKRDGNRLVWGPTPYIPDSFYALECSIPPPYNGLKSGIISIWLKEEN